MSEPAISARNISKQYTIGEAGAARYKLLRDAIAGLLKSPLGGKNRHSGQSTKKEFWALRDVSFDIPRGEVLGVIGRNGAGKSTLLKILSRITEPTEGCVDIYGRVGSLLEVGTGFHQELTGRENIYLNGAILGMKRAETEDSFDEIVEFAEVSEFIDTPVKRYSSGMYLRLAFAVAAHLNPDILLVDEVLAVGDAAFQKKCLGKMGEVSRLGRTVIFVSHNMEAILNLCERCFVLENGRIIFDGKSEEAVAFYLKSFSSQNTTRSGQHVVFEQGEYRTSQSPQILRIEALDALLSPKPVISTWDEIVFRLHYVSDQEYLRGSFILDFYDYKQQRLIVLDSGSRLPIEKGTHHVDCRIGCLPLAAGEFYVGAGLAVSNTEWLWREPNLALIRVHGKDVFDLGRPPVSTRMIFALSHEWRG